MCALLLIQIFDHWRIFPCESFESFLASRVRHTTGVENKSTAVAGLVLWDTAAIGKAKDSHGQMVFLAWRHPRFFGSNYAPRRSIFRSDLPQLLRILHSFEGFHQRRKRDRQLHILKQP